MLADDGHGARLRAVFSFAFMQCEAHLHAGLQQVEFAIGDAIAMEIDLLPVASRTDETILRKEPLNGPVSGRSMLFDVAA